MQSRRPILIATALCSALSPPLPAQVAPAVRDSIVKVTSTIRQPDWTAPWRRAEAAELVGTGMVLSGGKVLTCAHLVKQASRIHIQPDRSAQKLLARVTAFSEELDIALLEPLEPGLAAPGLSIRAEIPRLQETVQVLGYPIAGSELATTEGVVSRIQYIGDWGTPGRLMIQVDAAMNPGNSGGPAILDDAVVGMAVAVGSGNSVGFLLAGEELEAFVAAGDEDGYQGRAQLFGMFQTFENSDLKAALSPILEPGEEPPTGMVVTRPYPDDAENPLRPMDLITHIGGHRIQDDGMVTVRDDLRLEFQYMVPRVLESAGIPLTVVRDGAELTLHVPARTRPQMLLRSLGNDYPEYFIVGPLAFMPAYEDFWGVAGGALGAFLQEESPFLLRAHERPAFPGEELVLALPTLFDHAMTTGYMRPEYLVVHSVNEARIRNLRHLVECVRDSDDEFLRFTFHGRHQETIVLDRTELIASTEGILEDNGIRTQASEELLELWNTSPRTAAPDADGGSEEVSSPEQEAERDR